MTDDKKRTETSESKQRTSALGELAKQQPRRRRVRVQTGTHSSQLDYARRVARNQREK